MKNSLLIFLLAIALCLICTGFASAATRTTSQSGNWSATSTWGGNPIPVAGDNVIINGGFTVTVDIPDAACSAIQLGGSTLGTGSGTMTFNSGSHVTVTGAVTLGVTTNTPGSLNMTGGGILTCEGFIDNRLGTWTAGSGTIELSATNTVPNNNNIIFNNLTVSGGTTFLARNVSVGANLAISNGAVLDGGANVLTVGGGWQNDGTFTGNTGTVTFNKNGNQTIAGNGLNNFNLIRVNLGTSIANTLEVVASHFNAPDGFLTITNGTFKISGTFAFTNTFITGPAYNIQPTSGLWINNPNVTVAAQAGGISVRGLLRITAGTYNVGLAPDQHLDYVAGSAIIVDGGAITIAGRLGGNNASSTTSYTQSGGTVTVVAQGSTDIATAGFDLSNPGNSFTMSGGTIVIRNATSFTSDYLNSAATASVTGGTLQAGDAASSDAQIIRIQSARPIGNLFVSGATSQATKPTAIITASGLNVIQNVAVGSGSTLNANGFSITVGGNWSDSGAFVPGGNTVTFSGSGPQLVTDPAGESFNNLTVNKTAGALNLNNSVTVANTFQYVQGAIGLGGKALILDGQVASGGTLNFSSSGTVSYNQNTPGQSILPGNYGDLLFSDFSKILPQTGTIGISGTFIPGSTSLDSITGSTIDFNGGAQNIPAFAYNNLTLSGSGTKTGTGTITVNGVMINNPGILFTGASVLNLNGPAHTNGGTVNTATLSIGPGAVLSNAGNIITGFAISGSGTLTQAGAASLTIGGTAGLATLNAGAVGNTVNYSGNGQTIIPAVYHHLLLSGSGAITLTGIDTLHGDLTISGNVAATAANGMSIGGNIAISTGSSFDAGAFVHTLKGGWSNSGLFLAGGSTLILGGTAPQAINSTNFNNLTVNNFAGVTMTGDVTANGVLDLASGTLTVGPHTLTINGALTVEGGLLAAGTSSNITVGGSGPGITLPSLTLNNLTLSRPAGNSLGGDVTVDGVLSVTAGTLATGGNSATLGSGGTLSEAAGHTVIGTIRITRNVAIISGLETFGNIGVSITPNGTAPGSTTIERKTGTASSGNGHSSILRSFDITPAVNTGLNAALSFRYDSTELNSENPPALELYRSKDNGTTWNNLGGVVNTAQRTITIHGINEFSRWTAADTAHSLGNTPVPVTVSITPASRFIDAPAFTLAVNGTDFAEGKSTVYFNGNARSTSYVNSTQLTALIPASDIVATGSFPVTVQNSGGGGVSNAQTFTVNPLPPVSVSVETAADGSGTVVPVHSIPSGSSITVYAISRDTLNNFVANVAASNWSLGNITGGVASSDLIPAADGKSALFTARLTGSAVIITASGLFTSIPSGTITVTAGPAAKMRVETAADGQGVIVPAQSLVSGSSIRMYAVTRDSLNNFVSNVSAASWTLANTTGGVVAGDLVPDNSGKSALFTAHLAGAAEVKATSGILPAISSGKITVIPSAPATIRIETASDGSGVELSARLLSSGSSLTLYAIERDTLNNFVANISATTWELRNRIGGVVAGDLVPAVDGKSAVFTGHVVGQTEVAATAGSVTAAASGTITVIPGPAVALRVETAGDGSGTIVPSQSIVVGVPITVYAATRDSSGNFIANDSVAAWTLENITGGIASGDLVPAADGKSAVFTGHQQGTAKIKAAKSPLSPVPSGIITVTPGTGVIEGTVPAVYALEHNYPNPFNPATTVRYALPVESKVRLAVYNALGQLVVVLEDGVESAGFKSFFWNASGAASGIYYYRLNAISVSDGNRTYSSVGKMLLLK